MEKTTQRGSRPHKTIISLKIKEIIFISLFLFSGNCLYGQSALWNTNVGFNNFGVPECGLDYRAWYNGRVGVMTIGQPLTTLHLHTGLNPTDDYPCEPVKLRLQSSFGTSEQNLFMPAYMQFFSNRMNNPNQWQVSSIRSELFTPGAVLTAGSPVFGGLKFFGGQTIDQTDNSQNEVFRIGNSSIGINFDESADPGTSAPEFQLPIEGVKLEAFDNTTPRMRITGGPCLNCTTATTGKPRFSTLEWGIATQDIAISVLGKEGDAIFRTANICQRDIRMSVQGYGENAAFNKFRIETGNIDGGITEKAVFGAQIGSTATPFPAYLGNQERTHSILELRRSDRKDGNASPSDPPRFRDQNTLLRFTRVAQLYSQLPIPNSISWLVGVDGMSTNPDITGFLGHETGQTADQFKINNDVFRICPMRVSGTKIAPAEYPTGDVPGLSINPEGRVAIGCNANKPFSGPTDPVDLPTHYLLAVKGLVVAQEIVVTNTTWADFVFKQDYKLRPLDEVEQFIKDNGHLPDVPSEKEVQRTGVDLGKTDAMLLQKIEELTLYMIQLKKENDTLKQKVEQLSSPQGE
ncbi:MAG: hypothetical protein ACK6DA_11985 [Candidatus Kapaibacterium sp.]